MVDNFDPAASAISAYVMPDDRKTPTFSDHDFVSMAHPTIYRKLRQRPFVTEYRRNAGMETIGDRVRRLRESQGIERKDLAHDVGLSYSGLSDLESGKAKSSTKLHRLAAALGVSSHYLETGKNDAASSIAVAGHSQTVRLDAEMILDVVHSLQEVFKEIGLVYSVEEEPGLFAEFLEDRIAMRDIRSVEARAKVGKWLRRDAVQGDVDERASPVPVKGTHKGKTGGSHAKG